MCVGKLQYFPHTFLKYYLIIHTCGCINFPIIWVNTE
jgi:hypothetical protein